MTFRWHKWDHCIWGAQINCQCDSRFVPSPNSLFLTSTNQLSSLVVKFIKEYYFTIPWIHLQALQVRGPFSIFIRKTIPSSQQIKCLWLRLWIITWVTHKYLSSPEKRLHQGILNFLFMFADVSYIKVKDSIMLSLQRLFSWSAFETQIQHLVFKPPTPTARSPSKCGRGQGQQKSDRKKPRKGDFRGWSK